MRDATLIVLPALLSAAHAQNVSSDSVFCWSIGMWNASAAMWTKEETMIGNLNADTTLQAQQTRITNWLNNNWQSLWDIKDQKVAKRLIGEAKQLLGARWRIVTYLKGLLVVMKPKLADAKFNEACFIRDILWLLDQFEKQNVSSYYPTWKIMTINVLTQPAKKVEIQAVIDAYESQPAYAAFQSDMVYWSHGLGYRSCWIVD